MKTNDFLTPIDKVSNNVWTDAQRRTSEAVQENKVGYSVDVAKQNTVPINVHLAVWNEQESGFIIPKDEYGNPQRGLDGKELKIGVTLNYQLSEFDRFVHDAICSIVVTGNFYFSPFEVYEVMVGRTTGQRCEPTDKMLMKIHQSIVKIFNTRILLNFKDEAINVATYGNFKKSKKFKEGIFVIDEHLLNMRIEVHSMTDIKAVRYKYLGDPRDWDSLPAMYRYASPKKQIANIDISKDGNLLNAKNSTSVSVLELEHYLHRKINAMRSKIVANNLHIETIFSDLHMIRESIDELSYTQRTRIYKKIEKILDNWVEQGNLIEEWHWEMCYKKNSIRMDDRGLKKGKIVFELSEKKKAQAK